MIIKVASIQAARMQVYFIDNEDYFQRKFITEDENGNSFDDNDERSIFFVRGVMETVKKLRWVPDIIHCHGWMTALAPLYIKKAMPKTRVSEIPKLSTLLIIIVSTLLSRHLSPTNFYWKAYGKKT